MKKSEQLSIRLPTDLCDKLDKYRSMLNFSRTAAIRKLLTDQISTLNLESGPDDNSKKQDEGSLYHLEDDALFMLTLKKYLLISHSFLPLDTQRLGDTVYQVLQKYEKGGKLK